VPTQTRRPYTRAIRDILEQGPTTEDQVVAKTWHLFPAGACIARYRGMIDGHRRRMGSSKVGYDRTLDQQHRLGASLVVRDVLYKLIKSGKVVKEGDRFRLV